jgi:hypothetical protein
MACSMHVLIGRELPFEMIQELHELPAAVALLTSADDFAIQDVERGEQSGGAIAFVVVRLAFRQAGPQWEDRRGAIQSLNLALLVHTQYQGAVGWIQVEAYDIPHLFFKVRRRSQHGPVQHLLADGISRLRDDLVTVGIDPGRVPSSTAAGPTASRFLY